MRSMAPPPAQHPSLRLAASRGSACLSPSVLLPPYPPSRQAKASLRERWPVQAPLSPWALFGNLLQLRQGRQGAVASPVPSSSSYPPKGRRAPAAASKELTVLSTESSQVPHTLRLLLCGGASAPVDSSAHPVCRCCCCCCSWRPKGRPSLEVSQLHAPRSPPA